MGVVILGSEEEETHTQVSLGHAHPGWLTGWLLTVGADHLHRHVKVTGLRRRRGLVVNRLQLRQGQSGGYHGYRDAFQTLPLATPTFTLDTPLP